MNHLMPRFTVRDATGPLSQALGRLTVQSETQGDDVIDETLSLAWAESGRRIMTGSDFLGRSLRKSARNERAVGTEPETQPAGKTCHPTSALAPTQ